jgi:hypothetical protein
MAFLVVDSGPAGQPIAQAEHIKAIAWMASRRLNFAMEGAALFATGAISHVTGNNASFSIEAWLRRVLT